MYHLKLCRGRSYCNAAGTVKATRQQPNVYTADKATADAAVASGFFKLVEEQKVPDFLPDWEQKTATLPPAGEVLGHLDREQLEDMTVVELRALAADMGVDIKGCKDKASIIAAIAAEKVSAPAITVEELAELSLEELTAFAEKNGISLEGVPTTKEDVLEAICVANGGSYTMLDLMRE
ncbi:MAG: hypothetical protein K2O18_13645 [Oscillospiraceae bacterium]|nr:hypothetical protein [Oscillospiraceae bacterium]